MPYTWMGMFVMRVMIPRGIIAPEHAMTISGIDWAIVAAYFLLSAGIGLYFTKRGGQSLDQYFLSGRQAPWWLAGTAMVATTFAADTPLVVTALVATKGVAGNWLWWNFVMSGMLTVFFFARLWRRAEVMTDVELAELRYGGGPAAFLRGFRALYLAIPINLIILGWVTRAMIKILTIALGLKDVSVLGMTVSGEVVAVGICFAITAIYAVAAGMWAVMWTDLVQFIVKMSAVIVLAVYSVRAVVGGVVPGRRARGRRLCRPAHLQRALGEGRRARHPLLPDRPLRAPALALDHHRPRHGRSLPDAPGSRGWLRAGLRGSPAHAVARLHAGGIRRRLHEHGGD